MLGTAKEARQDMEQSLVDAEYERRRVEQLNISEGKLTGYDCSVCLNKGYIYYLSKDDAVIARECECTAVRRTMKRFVKSGLRDLIDECTFENFRTDSPWQKHMKELAQAFVADFNGNWFFCGGQVGAGKTHICAAIVCELVKHGIAAQYMLWRDNAVFLKAIVTDAAKYGDAVNEFKKAEILFIDDFFKTGRGESPTGADIQLAFEILNYRYNVRESVTIISSELLIDDILLFDEGTGSRIFERSRKHCVAIERDRAKNFRLR